MSHNCFNPDGLENYSGELKQITLTITALKRETETKREGCNLLKVSSRDRHLLQRHKPLAKNKK